MSQKQGRRSKGAGIVQGGIKGKGLSEELKSTRNFCKETKVHIPVNEHIQSARNICDKDTGRYRHLLHPPLGNTIPYINEEKPCL